MTTEQRLQALQEEINAKMAAILQEEESKGKKAKGKKEESATKKGSKKNGKDAKKATEGKGGEVDPLQQEIDEATKEGLARWQKASKKEILAEVSSWWEGRPKIQKAQVELYGSLSLEDLRKQILFDWGLEGGESFFAIKGEEEETPPEKKEGKKNSKDAKKQEAKSKDSSQSSQKATPRKDPGGPQKQQDAPPPAKKGKAFEEFYFSNNASDPRKDHILVCWWNSTTEDHSLGEKNERGAYISVGGMKAGSKEWKVALEMARACATILAKETPPKGFDKVAVMK